MVVQSVVTLIALLYSAKTTPDRFRLSKITDGIVLESCYILNFKKNQGEMIKIVIYKIPGSADRKW